MDVDAIFSEINGWGRYQKGMYVILCLPSIMAGAAVISLSWIGYDMAHRCLVPSCEDAANATYNAPFLNFTSPRESDPADPALPWSQCHVFNSTVPGNCSSGAFDTSHQVDCGHYVYDKSVMHSSIVSEFELSCGRDWLPTLANSLYMGGMLVGSLVFGYVSDRFGRKKAMMLSFLVLGLASLVASFAPDFGTFAAMRFLTGVGGMGTFMITFVLAVELVSNEVRTFCGFAIELFFSFGECLVGLFALFIKDWWILQLVIALPVFAFLAYWVFVPESPRWLATEGRQDEAEAILRKMAKVNGKDFPEQLLKLTEKSSSPAEPTAAPARPAGSVLDLIRSPALRWRTLIVLYQWFVCAMVYYGLAMNATNLGGNVYVNFVLVQLVDWPSNICCILLLDPWGRKLCTSLSFLLGGIGSIASGLVAGGEGMEVITVALALVGKFGACAAFNIAFVYGAELFPTDLRNTGIGLSSASGRIGCIVAPVIASLGKDSQVLPMSVFGVLSVIAGMATMFLPETYGQNLPDTIEESEAFGRHQSVCFVPCLERRRKPVVLLE